MKKTLLPLSLVAAASLCAASSSNAQMLQVGYSFAGVGGNTAVAPVFTDPNATLSDITRGPGFSNADGNYGGGFGVVPTGPSYAQSVSGATNGANQVAAGAYVKFTLTPTAGESLSLTNLEFGIGIQNGSQPNPILTGFSYSTDGTNFTTLTPATGGSGAGGGQATDPVDATYDLASEADLQNLTQTATFRLFLLVQNFNSHNYESGAFRDTTNANGLDVEVDGTAAAAPEPSTWAMITVGTALLAFGVARRRHA